MNNDLVPVTVVALPVVAFLLFTLGLSLGGGTVGPDKIPCAYYAAVCTPKAIKPDCQPGYRLKSRGRMLDRECWVCEREDGI